MQNFDASAFLAMPAAKAKVAALAMFDAAMIEPAADWRGVAFALHAVVSRKRGKVAAIDDIAMADSADAGEFTEWADYAATGKAANIARGRVTVTFADGWTRTVGMLAGKTAKGRKPWSIAHAVRFAVLCYKLAAARRATGSDRVMYFDKGGNAAGESVALNGLIACPEIVSVISADSAETVEGDLAWNHCEANAFTLDLRAGAVEVPLSLSPMPAHIADALSDARRDLLASMGLDKSGAEIHMIRLNREASERVHALLSPWDRGRDVERAERAGILFKPLMDSDPEGFLYPRASFALTRSPAADEETVQAAGAIIASNGGDASQIGECYGRPYSAVSLPCRALLIQDALVAWPAREEPAPADPRADLPQADLETMLAAQAIVGTAEPDAFADSLSAVAYVERFRLVEDALLAWPALVVVEDDTREPEAGQEAVDGDDAPMAIHAADNTPNAATPSAKPRYRYSPLSGRWELIPDASGAALAA